MLAVIQFDSPSLAVLDRMLARARLPALAGLRGRGAWHELETPATHFAAGAFHTLYSGMELADHGLFYPFQWSAADQRVRYTTAFPAPPPVWERPGGRTLAMDPYESRPPRRRRSGPSSAAGSSPTGSCCSRGRCRRGSTPALETLFGAARSRRRRCSGRSSRARAAARCAATCSPASGRAADAAALLLAESSYDLDVAHVQRRARRRAPVLGPVPARRRGRRDAPGARRRAGGRLRERRRRLRPRARRAARGDGRDRDVAGRGWTSTPAAPTCCPRCSTAVLDAAAVAAGRRHRVRVDLAAAGRAADRALRARVASALPDRVALDADRAPGAARRGLDDDPRLRPARRQPGLRPAEPARPRARRHRRAGRGRGADGRDRVGPDGRSPTPDGAPAVTAVERVADTLRRRRALRPPARPHRALERPPGDTADRGGVAAVRRRCCGSGARQRPLRQPHSGRRLGARGARRVDAGHPSRPPRLVDIAATAAALAGRDGADLPGGPLLRR